MNSIQELYFTDKDINQRWEEAQRILRQEIEDGISKACLVNIKHLLEINMEAEVQEIIGARHWEHNTSRRNWRNGRYSRSLWTQFGWISDINVPRLREVKQPLKTIERYNRRSDKVNKLILEMFLQGVSTRKVKEVLRPLYGQEMISATTVSRISKELDKEVNKFHRKSISDDYKNIFLDGIYLKAKSPVRSKSRCILVAYGIKKDGSRELIDFKLARNGESQIAWESFLTSLYNRGLTGKNLELIVIDGNKGLYNAVDLVFPEVKKQRCWAHKLRNVANKLPKKIEEVCINEARDIYNAESKHKAIKSFKGWAGRWKPIVPQAVECLEKDLDELLNFYECPKVLWKKLRTTNLIERVFREVRRRTRPMSCFTNTQSVERIIFAVFNRQNNIWKDKPFKKITQNS